MKMLLPQIGLLFLLLLPLLGRAQETRIRGRVMDAQTKQPIPFASISLRETEAGALSNEEGCFEIKALLKNQQDSLICMTMGYKRKSVSIERGQTDSLRIEITAHPYGFTETVSCAPRAKEGKPLLQNEVIAGLPGTRYAFFIRNDKHQQYGNIRWIALYTGGNGLPKRKFRLHFYEADSARPHPGKALLNTPVSLMLSPCKGWETYGLMGFQVMLNKTGCYVGLEFVEQDAPTGYFGDEPYQPYVKVMRVPSKASEQSIWTCTRTEGWKEIPATGSISLQYGKMIKVAVDLLKY